MKRTRVVLLNICSIRENVQQPSVRQASLRVSA